MYSSDVWEFVFGDSSSEISIVIWSVFVRLVIVSELFLLPSDFLWEGLPLVGVDEWLSSALCMVVAVLFSDPFRRDSITWL